MRDSIGERKQPDVLEGEDLVELTPEEVKRRLDESRHLPGWIEEQVDRREREQGWFP